MPALSSTADVRRRNIHLVMRAIRRLAHTTRVELAKQTALSPATISGLINTLLASDIVLSREVPDPNARRGRPRSLLSLNPNLASVISMVMTNNGLSGQLLDYAGNIIVERQLDANMIEHSLDELSEFLMRLVIQLMNQSPTSALKPLRYMVLTIQGGIFNEQKQMLATELERLLHVPVILHNACESIAEALRWSEPQRFANDFAVLMLSDQVEMALVLLNKLYSEHLVINGQFGHLLHELEGAWCRCGQYGCIEAYAAYYGIWRTANQWDDKTPMNAAVSAVEVSSLLDKALLIDGFERYAYQRAGRAIGHGLHSLFALLYPLPIVFVGASISKAMPIFMGEIEPIIKASLQTQYEHKMQYLEWHSYDEPIKLAHQGAAFSALRRIDQIAR